MCDAGIGEHDIEPALRPIELREEVVETQFKAILETLKFSEEENEQVRAELKIAYGNVADVAEAQTKALQLQLEQSQARLSKIADLYIDGMIEKDTYIQKKNNLLEEQVEAKGKLKNVNAGRQQALQRVEEFVELVNNACLSYEMATIEEKRELIKIVTSNLTLDGKSLIFKLQYPFQMVAERRGIPGGSPQRGVPRTLLALISELRTHFAIHELRPTTDEERLRRAKRLRAQFQLAA